jgi:glycosyltransferase involved in cell wall biosynthesis
MDGNRYIQTVIVYIGLGDFTGAVRMGLHFSRAFKDAGFRVVAIVGEPPSLPLPSVIPHLRAEGIEVIEEHGFARGLDIALVLRCLQHSRRLRPILAVSMVQLDVKIAGLACLLAGIPLIVSAQSRTTFYGSPLLRWLKSASYGLILRLSASMVVCTSSTVAGQFREVHRIIDRRIRVLPNGVETLLFGRDRYKPAPLEGVRLGCLRVLSVGRLDPQKGQLILLEALRMAVERGIDLQLWLVGDATPGSQASVEYAMRVREAASSSALKDRVFLLGWRDDIAELNLAVDAYVHAALWEGPPLTLSILEAMSSSRPVLFTDCVGVPDGFVDGVHGFVVRHGDAQELCKGLLRLSDMTLVEREAMGRRAQELARDRYDVAPIGAQFVDHCCQASNVVRPPCSSDGVDPTISR